MSQVNRREYKREWSRKRRAAGLPAGGRTDPEWMRAYKAKWDRDPANKARAAEKMRERRQRPDVRFKDRARREVKWAIDAGRLKRLPCEKCGQPKTQAHHDDYSKPLEVRWLCLPHHKEHHRKADAK